MTLAQLQQLDFGWNYKDVNEGTFPYRGRGVQILTLKELLQSFPTARVNIDIKPEHPASLQRLLQVIAACNAEQRVFLACFHHQVLARVRQMTSQVGTGASPREVLQLYARSQLFNKPADPGRFPFCALQVPIQQMGFKVVNRQFVQYAHGGRVAVHVWTVDDASQWEWLWEAGVDGIVTNRPREAVMARDIWWRRHLEKTVREA
jgi:glycerophosphoryl diester phosphodiesterase